MHMTSSHAMGETSFFLVYGAEAVLQPDIRLKSSHVLMFSKDEEPERCDLDLMLLEEEHDRTAY